MSRLTLLGIMAILVIVMWGMAFVSKRLERVAEGVAPLETRSFDAPSLVTVGTGGTFENPSRLGPSLAVGLGEEILLVDAGRGLAEALRAAEIPAWQPRRVFLTSLLPENTVGLDDLLTTGWLGPREVPLEVYGPAGTVALVSRLREAHEAGLSALGDAWDLPAGGGRIEAFELEDGARVEAGALSVRAAALAGSPVPALAYRIEAGERSVVVASFGTDAGTLTALAEGADALAVGAVYGASLDAAAEAGVDRLDVIQREAAYHFRLEDLGVLASEAGVRTLVLTRLRPPPVFHFQYEREVGETYRGNVVVAEDGGEVEL